MKMSFEETVSVITRYELMFGTYKIFLYICGVLLNDEKRINADGSEDTTVRIYEITAEKPFNKTMKTFFFNNSFA